MALDIVGKLGMPLGEECNRGLFYYVEFAWSLGLYMECLW